MDTIGYISNPTTLTALNQLEPNRYKFVILDKTVDNIRLPNVQQQLRSITLINLVGNVFIKDYTGFNLFTIYSGTSVKVVPNNILRKYNIASSTDISGTTYDAPLVPNLPGADNKYLWTTSLDIWGTFNFDVANFWTVANNSTDTNWIHSPLPVNITKISICLREPQNIITHIKITAGNSLPPNTVTLYDQDDNFTGNSTVKVVGFENKQYYTYFGIGLTIGGTGPKEINAMQLYGSY